jgi:site-specific recombinase XerD
VGLAAAFGFVIEQIVLLGHRALTVDTNSRNIGRFARYCGRGLGLETIEQVTPEVVRAFVYAASARNKPPSPGTMHGRRTAVRLAFRILIQFGLHESDPTRFVKLDR